MRAGKWPITYLLLMALAALAASLSGRYTASKTCEMDGQELSPTLRVDLRMADGVSHAFCTIECARRWLAQQPNATVKEAVVRDALTGEPLDAYVAFFVRSKLVTNRANGNNIHAFRFRADAAEHIRRFGGQEIDDPFGVQ
jgi:hypothetical protein